MGPFFSVLAGRAVDLLTFQFSTICFPCYCFISPCPAVLRDYTWLLGTLRSLGLKLSPLHAGHVLWPWEPALQPSITDFLSAYPLPPSSLLLYFPEGRQY